MSDYEHIVVSAVRYALGRMTYIVELTVDYVLNDISENRLSEKCLQLIKRDIEESSDLGMDIDEKNWNKLLNKIYKELRLK